MGQKPEQSSESSGAPSLQAISKFNFQVEAENKPDIYMKREWRRPFSSQTSKVSVRDAVEDKR